MRVLVDAVQLTERVTGTDRLAHNVLRELTARNDGTSWTVLVHQDWPYVCTALHPSAVVRPVPGRMRFRWLLKALPDHARDVDADVVMSFHNCIGPLRGRVPAVVSVLDVIPFHFSEGYFSNAAARTVLRTVAKACARRAAQVVTISEHGRDDAVATLGLDPQRLHVAPLQADPRFQPAPPEDVARARAALGLPASYVLVAGADEPRKNVSRVVEAHGRLPGAVRAAHPLVVMGPPWGGQAGDAPPEREHVLNIGYVPEEHLVEVFSGATVFAFLSSYEGFGLPVLEAMACHVPVLLSNSSSLPEVGGDAALYADPDNLDSIRAGLERLLESPELRRDLIERGVRQVAKFSWQRAADVYAAAIAAAARGRR